MEATKMENPDVQNEDCSKRLARNLGKRKALDLHNQRRREKRQGIYDLTSWHVSRLRKMEERQDDDYVTFTSYIKWKGGIPPNENDFQEENDYLSELKDVFDSYNGYNFFQEHGLMLPPLGVSMEENPFF